MRRRMPCRGPRLCLCPRRGHETCDERESDALGRAVCRATDWHLDGLCPTDQDQYNGAATARLPSVQTPVGGAAWASAHAAHTHGCGVAGRGRTDADDCAGDYAAESDRRVACAT